MGKMKKYMNSIDREHHLMLLIFWDYINNWLNKTSCLSPEERKRLKTVATHLLHTSDSIINRMDNDYAVKLIKEAGQTEVKLEYRVKNFKEQKDIVIIETDTLYDIANYALADCRNCEISKEDYRKCEKYRLFFELNIPVLDEEAALCPYEQPTSLCPERIKEIEEWLEREG